MQESQFVSSLLLLLVISLISVPFFALLGIKAGIFFILSVIFLISLGVGISIIFTN